MYSRISRSVAADLNVVRSAAPVQALLNLVVVRGAVVRHAIPGKVVSGDAMFGMPQKSGSTAESVFVIPIGLMKS